MSNPAPPRTRARLSRTFSRARWREYRRFLEMALEAGYEPIALEDWLSRDEPPAKRLLIMRHDVDQHPRSALEMDEIEAALGINSTWYFRWRTAHPAVIERLRRRGAGVGLHYETLTRLVRDRECADPGSPELLSEARRTLKDEIAAFRSLFGPIASVCPHGDTRVPGVSNAALLRGERWEEYGVRFDGNEAMRSRPLAVWLTDRSAAESRWSNGRDPAEVFASGVTPVLSVTHPNNWSSGPALWRDRLLSAVARPPDARAGRRTRLIRSGRDAPPI